MTKINLSQERAQFISAGLAPIEFTVTIQDLRPGHEGKIYRRKFLARTRFEAIKDAADTLLMTDSMEEGVDFHIVDCR